MRLALIADIHANLPAMEATLADIASQSVNRVVCLGDIVGYNTSPSECIEALRRIDALCVAGNHDLAVCGRITIRHFSATSARAVEWTRARLSSRDAAFLRGLPFKVEIGDQLVAVHGALHPETGCESVRLDSAGQRLLSFQALMAHPSAARICAFGHTHEPAVYELRHGRVASRSQPEVHLEPDAWYLVNPGTVGEPRRLDRRASYMIVDLARRTVTLRRVRYDAAAAFAATRQAGLAPRFSYVPPPVRRALAKGARALLLYRPAKRIAARFGS